MMTKQHSAQSELRQDLVTGKWVVIASGRSKRPDEYTAHRTLHKKLPAYRTTCPFCNVAEYPQEPDMLRLPDDPDKWEVHIFANKFPALYPQKDFRSWQVGPYRATEAVGYHEILATRAHDKEDFFLNAREFALQFEALILRYRQLRTEKSVNYIQIIKNHGEAAGGSLEHPHHQIFTVPVLPSDIADMLHGAEEYATRHKRNPFEVMLTFEREAAVRMVYENDHFICFCPFASRVPFETWVMPKKPEPFFENTGPAERESLADAMRHVLRHLYHGLKNPPYNYYIHSAPCDDTGFVCNLATFQHFRWHIEILPRLSKIAGFELGTGMEINTTTPESAAAFLREVKL